MRYSGRKKKSKYIVQGNTNINVIPFYKLFLFKLFALDLKSLAENQSFGPIIPSGI